MSKEQLRAFCLLFTMLRAVLMMLHMREDDSFVKECDEMMEELVRDCGSDLVSEVVDNV